VREFSYGNAWTLGVRFFAGHPVTHAIILIGLGVLLPLIVQFAIAASPEAAFGPLQTGDGSPESGGFGPRALVGSVVSYLLPVTSYFVSWRLGFGHGAGLSREFAFGFAASVLTLIGFILLFGGFAYGLGQLSPAMGVIAGLTAFMLFFAILLTTMAALFLVGLSVVLGVTMVLGSVTGNVGLAATLVGGSGFVVVLLIVVAGIMLWLASRLSCTTLLMAERRNLNLFAAMAESWRMTWDDEWRIMRYLAVIGLALGLLVFGAAFAAGAGLATFTGAPPSQQGIGMSVAAFVVGAPVAYLSVLVPAGIYRELAGEQVAAAEVFA